LQFLFSPWILVAEINTQLVLQQVTHIVRARVVVVVCLTNTSGVQGTGSLGAQLNLLPVHVYVPVPTDTNIIPLYKA